MRSIGEQHRDPIGLPSVQAAGLLQATIPAGVCPGSVIALQVPNSGGQSIYVEIPTGLQPGDDIVAPFEISASGLAQHPFRFPEGVATTVTTATIPPQEEL